MKDTDSTEKKAEGRTPGRILPYAVLAFAAALYIGTNYIHMETLSWRTAAGWAAVLCLSVAFCFFYFRYAKPAEGQKRVILFLCLLLVFFFIGLLRVYIFAAGNRIWHPFEGQTVEAVGTVESQPLISSTGKTYGMTFEVTAVRQDGIETKIGKKIQLYVAAEQAAQLQEGDGLRCTVKLRRPETAAYSGAFDSRTYYLQKECYFTAYADAVAAEEMPQRRFDVMQWWKRCGDFLRAQMLQSVDAVMPADSDANGLLKGILTGSKEGMSDDMIQDMSRSGFAHIAAVSGMHVSYLFLALTTIFSICRLRKGVAFALTVPVLLLFMSVAAFTPSVCRSVLMMLFFVLAYLLQREPDSITSLFASGFLLLLYNPYMLYSVSLLLSFSATLGILLFARPIQEVFPKPAKWHKPLTYLYSSFSLSLASMIGISFFVAYFFHIVSLPGLIANVWIIPLTAVLFLLGYGNWLLCLLSPGLANMTTGILLRPLTEFLVWSTRWFADSRLVFDVPSPPRAAFILYVALAAMLWCWLQSGKKKEEKI